MEQSKSEHKETVFKCANGHEYIFAPKAPRIPDLATVKAWHAEEYPDCQDSE